MLVTRDNGIWSIRGRGERGGVVILKYNCKKEGGLQSQTCSCCWWF